MSQQDLESYSKALGENISESKQKISISELEKILSEEGQNAATIKPDGGIVRTKDFPEFANTATATQYYRRDKSANPGYVCFDIETGKSPDAEKFQPVWKQPRRNKDGSIHASDKSLDEQENEWLDKTPLDAKTGMILAIGYNVDGIVTLRFNDSANLSGEEILLREFWNNYSSWRTLRRSIWGFNIKSFDLPFIAQRSFIHDMEVPIKDWRPWNLDFNDMKEIWSCGKSWQDGGAISFDNLCKVFGLEPKINNGKMFAANFLNQNSRHEAIAYLEDEMIKQGQIAEKFGAKRKEI